MIDSNYDLTLASLSYGPGDIGTPGAAGSTNLGLSPEPLPAVVPIPAAAWLFISSLLALFSLTSARSPLPSSRSISTSHGPGYEDLLK